MKQALRNNPGFSLVEVVLAIGVVAFCLFAILGMFPVALKTQQTSVGQTTANEILAQILADLRADVQARACIRRARADRSASTSLDRRESVARDSLRALG